MAEKHREVTFEQELVASLLSHGWQEGDPKRYDRALALYPDDLIGWLQQTQPQEWAKLAAFYHGDPSLHVLEYVAKLLDKEGALALLRRGFKDGNARFQLCQFKPSHGFNPQLQALYDGVRLRVVRQVHYSLHNENSIDVVLFANGIPLATLELKTDFTQSVQDAIRQYKYDRPPRDPGHPAGGAAAGLQAAGAGALRRQHRRGPHDHAAGRRRDRRSCPSTWAATRARATRRTRRATGRATCGSGCWRATASWRSWGALSTWRSRRSRSGSSSRATTSGRW